MEKLVKTSKLPDILSLTLKKLLCPHTSYAYITYFELEWKNNKKNSTEILTKYDWWSTSDGSVKLAGATLIYSVLIDFVVEEFHRLSIIVALLQGVKSKFELLLAFQ